ncbi:MAG: ATP-binding cassette domain-containing protein [Actinomycetes bacterium]
MSMFEAASRPASPAHGDPVGLAAADGTVRVDATSPWLLDSEQAAWEVVEGRVDVFGMTGDGARMARREFLHSFMPGEVLGGCAVEATGDTQLLAVGTPGTVLISASAADATVLVGPNGEPLEAWIALLATEREAKEAARIHSLHEQDLRALGRAEALVTGVTRRGTAVAVSDDDVVVAVTALATTDGFPKPTSIGDVLTGDLFDRVQTLSGAIGARARRVRREAGWWSEPGDGFISQDASGRAVAVLPSRAGARGVGSRRWPFVAVIAGQPGPVAVDAELGTSLSLDGVVLQRVFGTAPLRRRDLLRTVRRSARAELVWSIVLAVASSLMALLVPITLGKVVSSAVPNRQEDQIVGLIVMLFAAGFGAFVFDVVRNLTLLRLGGEYDRNLLPAIWDRVLRLPVGFFRDFNIGDLTSRVLGVDQARMLVSATIVQGVLAAAFGLVNMVLMVVVAPKLAIPAIVVLMAFGILAAIVTKSVDTYTRRALTATGRKDALTLQMIKGVSKIRVAGATATLFSRWVEVLSTASRARQRATMRIGVLGVAAGALSLATAAVVYAAAIVAGDEISVSTFAVFATSLGLATAAVASVPAIATSITTMRALVDRAEPILSARTEDTRGGVRPQLTGQVVFEDMHFAYSGDETQVLDGFSLQIPAGSFTAIVGPSGCGKSTVLRCLLGFEHPQRGVVLLDDHSLGELDLTHVRRQFGVVTQRLSLMGGSILSNITGPRDLTEDDAWAAAQKVGLADFIRTLPMGMRTMMIDGGSTLSGGQVQRVMLARALAGEPTFLLLDEATSALDNPTQQHVTESLAQMPCTRIVVAHRLSTVRDADQIAVMDRGRVVELGRHDELLARDGVYTNLVRRQL